MVRSVMRRLLELRKPKARKARGHATRSQSAIRARRYSAHLEWRAGVEHCLGEAAAFAPACEVLVAARTARDEAHRELGPKARCPPAARRLLERGTGARNAARRPSRPRRTRGLDRGRPIRGVRLASAFVEDAAGPDAFARLSRYETSLFRRRNQALQTLSKLQAQRQDASPKDSG